MIFTESKNRIFSFFFIKVKFLFLIIIIHHIIFIDNGQKSYSDKKDINVALCTMGKEENLYLNEFIGYYLKLGVNHIFIYDDNDEDIEKITNVIDKKYLGNITIYETKTLNINGQVEAFTQCYMNNYKKFDWFLMVDMDEFLYIINDSLKGYLTQKVFNKCDFIKIHWVFPKNNNLLYYDSRPLFERFKPPYIKSELIKSIIRGNITDLRYWIHSPYISPKRNVTCNNVGKKIYYKKMNFELIRKINIEKAYIIHFEFKSTEEFINKIKRGYSNWHGNEIEKVFLKKILFYLKINGASTEKIKFLERELDLNLSKYFTSDSKIIK